VRTGEPDKAAPRRGARLGVTRRSLLAAAAGAGASAAAASLARGGADAKPTARSSIAAPEPFHGTHQAGITTPAQQHVVLAAFDVTATSVNQLAALLADWSRAASALTLGRAVGSDGGAHSPPLDPGEARGLQPARLTVTFGAGGALFDKRFGLGRMRPGALAPLPAFRGDDLDPQRSDGDLCVQACADDPQVAFHAIHALSRVATGTAILRWSQAGFLPSSGPNTPRNLMGFRDGTSNLPTDKAAHDEHLWVAGSDEPAWMRNGTYLVMRRIRILFDVWDATSLDEQERTIGRHKTSGAPLGGVRESDAVDLDAVHAGGGSVIPDDAHIRHASASANPGSAHPASGLLVFGRRRVGNRPSRRRTALPLLPARPASTVRPDPAAAI
jgi:deferrochelatase/peroxidase EfeB